MDSSKRRFAEARLPLELLAAPLRRDRVERADPIVQIDIRRESSRRRPVERFRISAGA